MQFAIDNSHTLIVGLVFGQQMPPIRSGIDNNVGRGFQYRTIEHSFQCAIGRVIVIEGKIITVNDIAAFAIVQAVNNVRQISGGLAPLPSLPAGSAGLDIIMYEKRYSTLWEGNRWVDMRRWGRLGQLPLDKTGQFVSKVMPIPTQECDARSPKPRGCEGNL